MTPSISELLSLGQPLEPLPLREGVTVVLYGAGRIGGEVCRLLRRRGCRVHCFLDRRAQPGDRHEDVPVYLPEGAPVPPEVRESALTLITVFNYSVHVPGIADLLQREGYRNVVSFTELHAQLADELGDHYWLTSRAAYPPARDEIDACDALWADAESRDAYRALLRFRMTGDPRVLPWPDVEGRYGAAGLPPWQLPLRLVDGGAYDGDTVRVLLDRGLPIEALAAFEPDIASFGRLAAFAGSDGCRCIRERYLWPCALHSECRQLAFAGGDGEASSLSSDGREVVACVSLDRVMPTFRPNLVKMDVEGAEVDALLGARRLIAENRPGLAISLYHRPGHLWEVPLLLHSWGLGYRFRLRLHAHNGFDALLYGTME